MDRRSDASDGAERPGSVHRRTVLQAGTAVGASALLSAGARTEAGTSGDATDARPAQADATCGVPEGYGYGQYGAGRYGAVAAPEDAAGVGYGAQGYGECHYGG